MANIQGVIAETLKLSLKRVENTLQLLDEGCTIPFISRYRKEKTGAMDEVQVAAVAQMYQKLQELQKRRETVLKTITEQGKMTPQLEQRIRDCWDATELEDIYLPYKPKRRTRAQVAREMGLEPLATAILQQRDPNPRRMASQYVQGAVADVEAAIHGAQDIIAEVVSEDEAARGRLRQAFRREAVIISRLKGKADNLDEAAQKYSDYFDFSEPLRRCSGNRLLAMRRGESEGFLRVSITIDDDDAVQRLQNQFVRGRGECQNLVAEAVKDAYKRLMAPSMENEFSTLSKQKADQEAISVFAENLRQLLLAAPLGQKRVMGIDPGIRTGCKVVCLDAQGNLLYHDVAQLRLSHGSSRDDFEDMNLSAIQLYRRLVKKYDIQAIAIGNGTASRETTELVKMAETGVPYYVVSEDGASVYSASQIARDEFPDKDVTVRGAVSIGRRLMDPLSELVKIDPKSIGVGQYQHDVDQGELKRSLDRTVESCVNQVGVNLNTASVHLLTYVSGLGPTLARNIVEYRRENGAFTSRNQLLKVARLGQSAFQQCAGFLRIIPPAETGRSTRFNPLDSSAVHPESYFVVEKMAADMGCRVSDLISNPQLCSQIDIERYRGMKTPSGEEIGEYTLKDIIAELEKPGRDPRAEIETFEFDPNVHTPEDLIVGMVLPGIVTNITKFGAFVDIGVHQDGLVHISQLADRYVSDPAQVVHLGQHVMARVIEVDRRRNRISLSMKGI